MPEHDFDAPLDDDGREWIRFRFTTEGGEVTAFTVQYETTIDGKRRPVVRYDNAHGYVHRDLLDPLGYNIGKERLGEHLTLGEALTLGAQDIRENWRRYRSRFFGDEP